MVESSAENAIFVERRDRVGRVDGHIFKKQRGTTAYVGGGGRLVE